MTYEMGNQQPLHRTRVRYRNTTTATHSPAPKIDIEKFNKNKLDIKITAAHSQRFHIHMVQILTTYIYINNKYVQRPKKQQ